MIGDRPDDDPGWQFTWASLLALVAPGVGIRRAMRADRTDALGAMRSLFLTFCAGIVLIGVVVVILGDLTDGHERPGVSIPIVVVVGVLLLVAQRLLPTKLDCTSDLTLVGTYRTRFFLRIALSESAALVAFALDIALGPWWVYFVGLAFALAGFAMMAPTRAHLASDQDSLSLGGCQRSLVAALRNAQPPGAAPG
jgi:hypothetical protein